MSVSETGEIALDSAVELDDKELISMLDNNLSKVENYMRDEFKRARAEALLEKANSVKTEMNDELSEEEKAEIQTLKKNAVEGLSVAKQALENAISQAETTAKQFLSSLKQERKNK